MDGSILAGPVEVDTLVKMIKMAYAFENWEKVLTLSAKLLEAVNEILLTESQPYTKMDRHIAYYFGYAYLMRGLAYQKQEQFSASLECVALYSNLDYLGDSTKESKQIIDDYKQFARANGLTLEVLRGNRERLNDYVLYLEEHPDQILSGLITILESALHHTYTVDTELTTLMAYIKDPNCYSDQIAAAKYLSLHYLLAFYMYRNYRYTEALDLSLHTLMQSDNLGNDGYFKKSVALFEILKTHASVSQLNEYSNILKKIFKGANEHEKSTCPGSHFVESGQH